MDQVIANLFALLRQLKPLPHVLQADLTGKVVVVTGANTGLGFEAAKHFAQMNPKKVILACRSEEKGEQAVQKIVRTGYMRAEVWLLDLSSFDSVQAFADRFEKEGGGRLDILVENAAVAPLESYQKTKDGYMTTIQVNALAPSFHSLLMLPHMIRTAQEHPETNPRIVFVSSGLHESSTLSTDISREILAKPNFIDALSSLEYFNQMWSAVHTDNSSVLNIFFARALQTRLSKFCPIVVNSVDPGYCISDLRRSIVSGPRGWLFWLMDRLVAYSSEEGSRSLIHAALAGSKATIGASEDETKYKGAYLSTQNIASVSKFARSEAGLRLQETFWDDMVQIASERDERVARFVKTYF
ncbi:hypothetical protein GGU10DRAFT_313593 [Lentinula aff. detonsa]|uniref:NAD(P)-binding protein n=1 Tax=Lentinula aff. detonsa TaxID=2804958 RepID=A0AA38KQ49_9AGAR|nr:hypothetical protein GGU10DRAFT_313593 [Lentinula aff. detonsa]